MLAHLSPDRNRDFTTDLRLKIDRLAYAPEGKKTGKGFTALRLSGTDQKLFLVPGREDGTPSPRRKDGTTSQPLAAELLFPDLPSKTLLGTSITETRQEAKQTNKQKKR